MNRRQLLTALGTTAVGASALATRVRGAEPQGDRQAGHGSPVLNDCARACDACARECDRCFDHCAAKLAAGKTDHAETMHTCNDCAVFCSAAATLCARQSGMASLVCQSCLEACEICAKACDQFPDDPHMAACAKACRECAEACRQMIQHATRG